MLEVRTPIPIIASEPTVSQVVGYSGSARDWVFYSRSGQSWLCIYNNRGEKVWDRPITPAMIAHLRARAYSLSLHNYSNSAEYERLVRDIDHFTAALAAKDR